MDVVLRNLLLTLVLELPVVVLFIRKPLGGVLLYFLLVNTFTLPLATYVYWVWDWNFYLVEALVVVAEGLLYALYDRQKLPAWRAFLMALLANAFSAGMGVVLLS